MERAKREGTYQPGIGLNGGYEDEGDDVDNRKAVPLVDMTKLCIHCNKPGHLRKSNKLCGLYVAPKKRKSKQSTTVGAAAAAPTFSNDAEEADAMDAMPLQEDASARSNSSGEDAYFDAGEYSSDEDENIGANSCII